jgi:capsular exopolysaccharide synthesis family protein
MPAWQPASPPALRTSETWEEIPESGPAPTAKLLNAKVIWRAARRHWWQILVLWSLLSVGLMALAYNKIKTSFDATAWLIVRTSTPKIFDQNISLGDFSRYQRTQVELVTSSDVLGSTLAAHPELAALPSMKGVEDPEAEIRRILHVKIVPDTNLITVSMSSEDREEAKEIVDAVVTAYLTAAQGWSNDESQDQIKRLTEENRKLQTAIDAKKQKLRNLVSKLGNFDPSILKDQSRVSMERFQAFLNHLDGIKLRRIELESELESARIRAGRVVARAPQQATKDDIARAFYASEEVAALRKEKKTVEAKLESFKRITKKGNDPSRLQAQNRLKDLDKEINKLWVTMAPDLEKSLLQEAQGDESEKAVQELDAQLTSTKNMENSLNEALQRMEIDNKTASGDTLEVQFAQAELDSDKRLMLSIQNLVNQIEYDSKGPAKVDRANVRTRVDPSTNKRLKVMAATPIVVLAMVLALFVMIEVRSGRVADPDDLPARVRVEVIAVVPPLPSLRPSRALWGSRDEFRTRRQLEEFVQSLDHLRVALCAGRKGSEPRRCVLITSACSSEGKTTLAAHLAGRCANAGLSTLLIDADLRNPSLSRLLKVPDGPGLSDVLRGEITPEAAMMVIEPGGGFHLLPAGTSGFDPSRLLQGDQLAGMLGQLRQAFDMIIMDAPPVLLVPDALTVGRWTDGALLAVRYDTSRFPLVERAHRRLTAVGVPVIGAVVNGVRTMESSYGYYSYAYHASRSASASATIDVPAEPSA